MKKVSKSYIIKKILPACLLLIFVFLGLIKIDIINTKSLSPLGNTKQNYELVSGEFGEDFSNFIKDNAWAKIYKEKGEDTLVRLGNKDFRITNKSIFTKGIEELFNKIKYGFVGAKQTLYHLKDKVYHIQENN
ncbi:hypothetical protein [Clostridium uliginosum]|uniref:Uncharacterized protein n=1 Tax=Clostridium uliginosum TaxID=119641 RepID=A0A1I1KQ22_9CLOT|nr:hypothetical protein [Clostridium uliginosum]SFC62382.1 hypothetical protein SAMN05421842_10690 [Clostridium uliginosum]